MVQTIVKFINFNVPFPPFRTSSCLNMGHLVDFHRKIPILLPFLLQSCIHHLTGKLALLKIYGQNNQIFRVLQSTYYTFLSKIHHFEEYLKNTSRGWIRAGIWFFWSFCCRGNRCWWSFGFRFYSGRSLGCRYICVWWSVSRPYGRRRNCRNKI